MLDYNYEKSKNKFTENGHTMFEEDVLQRLKRLAQLEEKNKWIKVKNNYLKIELQDDILIKFKSLNREIIVVGHIFQGRFYMNYSDNAKPLENVMSFRCFL